MEKNQEIERKFLLLDVPDINYREIIRIFQAYKNDRPERIRREELFINPRKPICNFSLNKDPKVRYEHTLKEAVPKKQGLLETNKEIQESDFNDMISGFPNSIVKLRHVKPCSLNKGLKWEIDDFSCHCVEPIKLVLAEIEVPSMEYEVKIPGWLSSKIIKEVTGDACFSNFFLSKKS